MTSLEDRSVIFALSDGRKPSKETFKEYLDQVEQNNLEYGIMATATLGRTAADLFERLETIEAELLQARRLIGELSSHVGFPKAPRNVSTAADSPTPKPPRGRKA